MVLEIDVPDTPDGQTARELVRRRDICGMSFRFRVLRKEWSDKGELSLRILKEIELFEVSIVAEPAYTDTSIALRLLAEARRQTNAGAAAARVRRKAETAMRLWDIAVPWNGL